MQCAERPCHGVVPDRRFSRPVVKAQLTTSEKAFVTGVGGGHGAAQSGSAKEVSASEYDAHSMQPEVQSLQSRRAVLPCVPA
mmetsp:Transcript_6851/g.20836  ORF Transcript_6851/g.20836 Transcript_6851/m.20836 type:complete len:82 (-) Transcript_6851:422-667(-)